MRQRDSHIGLILFAAIFIFPADMIGQGNSRDSIWIPFGVFIGNWAGKGGGEPGQGEYEREYKFILKNKFIEVRNKSVLLPTRRGQSGELHEDIGYISYDKLRKTFILRQFHVEGFVNQYKLEGIFNSGKRIVFVSESIENMKPGWRAREIYEIISDKEISESFELAPPEKEFELYTRVTLLKK